MHELYTPSPSWFPLIAHKAGVRLFNLSAGLNHVSIKDQVVRACALVDSLNAANFLDNGPVAGNAYDVVVVGAGAAGVTAAWKAAALGRRVLVLEKAHTPFAALLTCTDRTISFSMYDWPESFCTAEHFPSLRGEPVSGMKTDEGDFPVYSSSDEPQPANMYAAQWLARLGLSGNIRCQSKAKHSIEWNFHVIANVQRAPDSLLSRPVSSLAIKLHPIDSADPHHLARTVNAAIVILATGIGLERTVAGGYNPPPFWSNDLSAPWHMPAIQPKQPRPGILISGAGDGAIQDALKSLFRKDIRNLIPVADELIPNREGAVIKQKLLAAERHIERQLAWGIDDIEAYRSLQRVYDNIAAAISRERIEKWRKKYLREDIHIDWLLGNAGVFTKAYPLNRFLASILKRSELSHLLTCHHKSLTSIHGAGQAGWMCHTDTGTSFFTPHPPLVRHGIEVYDTDLPEDYTLNAIRIALSRSAPPFKPAGY